MYVNTNLSNNSIFKLKLNRNNKPFNNFKSKIQKDISIFYKESLIEYYIGTIFI